MDGSKSEEVKREVEIELAFLKEMNGIVKNAYCKALQGDWTAIDDIKFLNIPEAFYIHFALFEAIAFNLNSFNSRETDVYEWFKKNHKAVLGKSCRIVKKKNNPKHIPDFWVNLNGNDIPVECKLREFTSASVRQLTRYMKFYGVENGIAVASECKCELPKNIIFIRHNVGLRSPCAISEGKP